MGFWEWLFGGKKETFVASSAYNLAGDESKRPSYLKTLVIRNIMSNTKNTIGDSIRNGYLGGPGLGLRSFFRWANNNTEFNEEIGMPTGILSAGVSLDMETIATYIPHGVGESVWAQDGNTGPANYGRWIEQWMLANYPDELENDWTADINDVTEEITITFEDTSVHSFYPTDFDRNSDYIYVYYSLVNTETEFAISTGTTVDLDPGDPFPSTTGWTLISDDSEIIDVDLVETITEVKVFSDSRPDEENIITNDSTDSYTYRVRLYQKETYLGEIDPMSGVDGIEKKREFMYFYEAEEIIENIDVDITYDTVPSEPPGDPDVDVTITTTTVTELLGENNSYRIDEQIIWITAWGPVQLYIYRLGSGITDLDDSVQIIEDYGKFFPYLPIRLNNSFLSSSSDAYEITAKAYRRFTGAELEDLVDTLAANPDIGDIDFAYVSFGVSLNVEENSCKKYLYQFFTTLMNSQVGGPALYTAWLLQRAGYTTAASGWQAWKDAQSNPLDPLYGTTEPDAASVGNVTLTGNQIRIANAGPLSTYYDMRIIWNYIAQGSGLGLAKPDAKVGELWFEYMGADTFASQVVAGNSFGFVNNGAIDKIRLYRQISLTSYTYLDIIGLGHFNYIYDGKYVLTLARDAIDSLANETGFIIPLHYTSLVNTRLVDSTQMATACVFIVFNCYEIVEQPWWQSGFFQIILIVVIAIAVAVFTGGVGIGLLGANAAIGATLGFSGLTAAIVGSVANALAAAILVSIITNAAISLFGTEIGTIVGSVLSFFILSSVVGFHSTGSFAFNYTELMKVDNLMMIMDAVGERYKAFVQSDIKRMESELDAYINKSQNELEELEQKYYELFGDGTLILDPLTLVDATGPIIESGDTFLTRTLMTGGDIAEMSMSLLNDYADLTLQLPNAYS